MQQTRGMVRHEAKRDHRRQQLPDEAVIVGLDIGKRRHAIWMIDPTMKPLGRNTIEATPDGLALMLAKAEKARLRAGLKHVVVALEPTGHHWMLIAKDLEDRGVDYLVVHPISVWRGREIRTFSYAKDDFRDASLIAELAAELHFTQARLRDGLWQTMRSLTYERFGLVELRSRARQETGAHLDVIFPNYPVFNTMSLASRAVLGGREVRHLAVPARREPGLVVGARLERLHRGDADRVEHLERARTDPGLGAPVSGGAIGGRTTVRRRPIRYDR